VLERLYRLRQKVTPVTRHHPCGIQEAIQISQIDADFTDYGLFQSAQSAKIRVNCVSLGGRGSGDKLP
jgi:hypothetical protein